MEWNSFLKYAKEHPATIPRDIKLRSVIYQECKSGKRSKLCDAIRKNKDISPSAYDHNKDVVMLQARVKACEDHVAFLESRSHRSKRSAYTA